MELPVLSVSDFVGLLNQTLEYAYPSVTIEGELANLRLSRGRWLYFDLKDEHSSVKFFGTTSHLPGPLEDGMMLRVRGRPRLHQLYGFSLNVMDIKPIGEGSLRRAAALLEAKLRKEGLFDDARKRGLPLPPRRIGLITSAQSAAYADFIKILEERWRGVEILLADVQVQGDPAAQQLSGAIEYFNGLAAPPDVLVITRGGGSADDLAAFNTEPVTRAVAASRIPTLVAIGHEVDISLAELAADQRASTPSNAAQLLVPDSHQISRQIKDQKRRLGGALSATLDNLQHQLAVQVAQLDNAVLGRLQQASQRLQLQRQLLDALSPNKILNQGYAMIYQSQKFIPRASQLKSNQEFSVRFADRTISAQILKKRYNK